MNGENKMSISISVASVETGGRRLSRPAKQNSFLDSVYCLLKTVIKNPILALVILHKVNPISEQYSPQHTFPQKLIVPGSEGLSVKEFEEKFESTCYQIGSPPFSSTPMPTHLPHKDEDSFAVITIKGSPTLVLDPKKLESDELNFHDRKAIADYADEDCQRAGDSRNIGLLPFMQSLETGKFYQLDGIVHASSLTDDQETNEKIINYFNQGAPCNPSDSFVYKYPERVFYRCSFK